VQLDPRPDPHPFRQFLVKIHSRCDLACRYCYLYTKTDQRWTTRPRTMSAEVVDAVARRIGEHTRMHRPPWVSVVLHGGEPLLAGTDHIAAIVRQVRDAVDPSCEVRFGIQTNGVRLTRERLALLRDLGVRIGVSLDGDQAAHDRHRRRSDGSGSYRYVAAVLDELRRPENADVYAGLICTVDLANDPVQVYEGLLRFRPPAVDFLLPEGNWSSPPPHRGHRQEATPYADWLIAVFDRWYDAPEQETRVRCFTDLIDVMLGGRASVVGTSLAPVASIVVETDGMIEACDALTATQPGMAMTGLSVLAHPFDAALQTPLVRERQAGLDALSETCRGCREVRVCGGGIHSQRYRRGSGFRNPSVYCPDLLELISHIRRRVQTGLGSLGLLSDSSGFDVHERAGGAARRRGT
jgi:uncharacterized protein